MYRLTLFIPLYIDRPSAIVVNFEQKSINHLFNGRSDTGFDWFPKLAISSAKESFKLKTLTTSNSKILPYAMNCLCAGFTVNPFVYIALWPFFIIGKRTIHESYQGPFSPKLI